MLYPEVNEVKLLAKNISNRPQRGRPEKFALTPSTSNITTLILTTVKPQGMRYGKVLSFIFVVLTLCTVAHHEFVIPFWNRSKRMKD
jgi:hypothetical protein